MITDVSIKSKRAIFAIKRKIKLLELPIKVTLNIFVTLITPILLYGSEVWGPFTIFDYNSWDISCIERVHTQFLKQILCCAFQSSNDMIRAEIGNRPLIISVITRYLSFIQNIQEKKAAMCFDEFDFERESSISPN